MPDLSVCEHHQRMDAMDACGYAHWLKCWHCGKHGDPELMYVTKAGRGTHWECQRAFDNARYSPERCFQISQRRRERTAAKKLARGVKANSGVAIGLGAGIPAEG